MNPGRRLSREFFERPCLEVAPELIGKWFLHRLPSGARVGGRLVEVEAYLGAGRDPTSHAHRGRTATLLALDLAAFAATLRVETGPFAGRVETGVEYEDICKVHIPAAGKK